MKNLKSLLVELPEDVNNLVTAGYFERAEELINIYLSRNVPQILKNRLEFEKIRINRLEEDYVYSFDEALEIGISKVKDFSKDELIYLLSERYADWILINGNIKFSKRFLENCIKVHPNIKDRLFEELPINKHRDILNKTINEIINGGEKKYFIQVKAGLRLKDEKHLGEKIKVHLPIPKSANQIKNINIIKTSHTPKNISHLDYPQRTIYFEEEIKGNDEFIVEYSFESHIKYNNPDYTKVINIQPNFYTNEWLPHIKFSCFLKELAHEIIGEEENPLLKARKIYDYITKNVQYSFMPQYIELKSVAEYGAYNLKGDCGVQALLFITLCRIVGIPARWQSGLYVDSYFIGCHDWVEFYVEPFGWLFADPSYGGDGIRNGDLKKWNFYFGNLDPFRMVANSEFHYPLYPEKSFLRQDPYDNQLGEVETDNSDLHGQWERILEIVKVEEMQ